MLWWLIVAPLLCARAAHEARNDSRVVVTYAGHAEASAGDKDGKNGVQVVTVARVEEEYLEHKPVTTEAAQDDVVFVPSGNRDDDGYSKRAHAKLDRERERETKTERDREIRVDDVVNKHTLGDIVNNRAVRVEKEEPDDGVYFISGKNNENLEQTIKKEEELRRSSKVAKELKEVAAAPLDCKHLNCDNRLKPLCGVKIEQKKPKYRLFLNECYFRKVNCGFSYDYNRYSVAPPEKCATVGSHYSQRQEPEMLYKPPPPQNQQNVQKLQDVQKANGRRNFSSRRAMTTNLDGKFCAHACPAHCPEDYSPECAVSSTGQSRVFLNHCQTDWHSCTHGSEPSNPCHLYNRCSHYDDIICVYP